MKELFIIGLIISFISIWFVFIFRLAKKDDRKTIIDILKEVGKKLKPILKEIKKNEKR